MNPVFEKFMQSMPLPGPLANITNVIGQFRDFANGFSGDPQQQVEQLRQSGRMDDQTFAQLSQWANKIYPFIQKL